MALTTPKVRDLLKDLMWTQPIEDREEYLPTRDQMPVLITFLRASKECESVKGFEKGMPKRAVCIADRFKDLHKETLDWVEENPAAFNVVYSRVIYSPYPHWGASSPVVI